MEPKKTAGKKRMVLLFAVLMSLSLLCSCGKNNGQVKLNPKEPVTISVWHYYNGPILNAFEDMMQEFNETIGMEKGIIVEGYGMGSIPELEKAVLASANKEVGSMDMPNVFASYADTAYAAETLGILADLGDYFTEEEQQEYYASFINEGKIGLGGELRIFPIAKATEVLMINDTDWQPFAQANGLSYDDLTTIERLVEVSDLYYHWTDELTPDIPDDGKAFFGRDSVANFTIHLSKELGVEIFQVENGTVQLNLDENVMRKFWDCHYVPYISGYMTAYGRYRSDDVKVGDLLAYVGSTTSTSYFPTEIAVDGETHAVTPKVLPMPHSADGENVMIQQGAGMVVTKSTPQEEYASIEFLKWFTDVENNIVFCGMSGYIPVKTEAMDYDKFMSVIEQHEYSLLDLTRETLRASLDDIAHSELYTNRAFHGGAAARAVLEQNLQEKAEADRNAVLELMANGVSHEDAVAQFNTDARFTEWLERFTAELERAIA